MGRAVGLVCFAAALLPGPLRSQSAASSAQEPSTYLTYRKAAKAAILAESAREKAGDCHDAQNRMQMDECLDLETHRTDENYRAYVAALGSLLRLDPPATGKPDVAAEFDHAEELWRSYRKAQCTALYDQYADGTIRVAVYGGCMQTLTRSHMHALDQIYEMFLTL